MAIDYTGITSIDAGAPDIKYTGDEGPKSPQEEMQIAGREYNRVLELLEKVRENMPLSEEEKMELQGLIKTLTAKGIPVEQLIGEEQGREGIQMASAADPMLEEQAVAGMATGGRVGLFGGGPPGVHGRETGGGYSDRERHQAQEKQAADRRESRRTSQYDSGPKTKTKTYTGPTNIHQDTGEEEAPYIMKGGKKHYRGSDTYEKEIKKSQDIVKEHQEKKPPIIKTVWDHLSKQKTSNARKYIAYLKSQGATIPDWLAAFDEEDAPKYLTEEQEQLLNYGWVPENPQWDPIMQQNLGITPHALGPMSYKDWKASEGNFNLLARGDLGNLKDLPNPGTVINPKTGLPFTDFEWDQHKRASGQGASSYDRGPSEPLPLWQRLGYGSEQEYRDAGGGPYLPVTPDPDPDPTPAPPETTTADPFQVASFSEADLDRIYGTSIPTTGTLGWTRPSPNILQHQFVADGGRIGYAGGGIADLRQGYFLGKLVKSITKPFKGITRGVKKFAKSPAGKLALMAALGGYGSGMFGSGTGSNWLTGLKKSLIGKGGWLPTAGKAMPGRGAMFSPKGGDTGWLGKLLLKGGADKWSMANVSPWKSILMAMGIGGISANDDQDSNPLMEKWLADKAAADAYWIPRFEDAFADGGRIGYAGGGDRYEAKIQELMAKGLSRELAEALVISELSPEAYNIIPEDKAQGGRIGYAKGGNDEEDHRSAALSAMYGMRRRANEGGIMMASAPDPMDALNDMSMNIFKKPLNELTEEEYEMLMEINMDLVDKSMARPRMMAQEGGLMDMGGMEKDYRNEGGFVPIGGQERADDVPARLSKNEFVFTADAVRNAGGGDIDKGAEIMENLMENLEQGGKVSEESQGLEGARDMFATSQRLEGVL